MTDTEPPRDHLPPHQGFISAAERTWVLRHARDLARGRADHAALCVNGNVSLQDPSESYYEVWQALCACRGGSGVPIPSYRHVRSTWDVSDMSEIVAWPS